MDFSSEVKQICPTLFGAEGFSVRPPCSSSAWTSPRTPPASAWPTSSPTRTSMRALWVWPTLPPTNQTSPEVSAPNVSAVACSLRPIFPVGVGVVAACVHESCFSACASTANQHGAIYLNTGLTSTKNYGKTILTKVSSQTPFYEYKTERQK